MTNPRFQPDFDNPMSNDAAREVMELTALFKETLSTQYDTIRYSEFKQTMLPMLARIANDQPFDIDQWLGVVSHPSLDVVVIDDHTGEAKYRVPSMFHKTDNSCKDDDIEGMSVYSNNIELMKSTDFMGAKLLFDKLAKERFDHTSTDAIIDEAIEAITDLNKIFQDHNLPLLPDPSILKGAVAQQAPKEQDPATPTQPTAEPDDQQYIDL